jgi:ElaB/YqjD/DUF883 family membrane-anchored ribosome-binding protein
MELYYKDLISKDASLDKLVEDLNRVVQGADEWAQKAGLDQKNPETREILSRLERLKENCRRVKEQAVAGAQATDKMMRRHPYSSAGIAFGLGLILAGAWCFYRSQGKCSDE